MNDHHSVTQWLQAAAERRPGAEEQLLLVVQAELRALAARRMAALPPGNTLQPTALVNEAWMRMARKGPEAGADRSRFFATAARAMRDILVEQARRKAAAKHGGELGRIDLASEISEPSSDELSGTLLDVEGALLELEGVDPRKAELVNLRFFAGLTTAETAAVLGVSTRTVEAQWQFTKRWLFLRLEERDV